MTQEPKRPRLRLSDGELEEIAVALDRQLLVVTGNRDMWKALHKVQNVLGLPLTENATMWANLD